jgi:hypothetical protein
VAATKQATSIALAVDLVADAGIRALADVNPGWRDRAVEAGQAVGGRLPWAVEGPCLETREADNVPRRNSPDVIGLAAMIVGILLAMSALMYLLVIAIASNAQNIPQILFVPGVVQIILGLLASIAGFFLRRGQATAKWVLLLITVGVVANGVLGCWIFLTKMQ